LFFAAPIGVPPGPIFLPLSPGPPFGLGKILSPPPPPLLKHVSFTVYVHSAVFSLIHSTVRNCQASLWNSLKFILVPATVFFKYCTKPMLSSNIQKLDTNTQASIRHPPNKLKINFEGSMRRAATNAAEKLRRTFMVHI